VTVRDLRNRGGEILDRVAGGETMTVTRDGRAIAELHPLRRRPVPATVLLERWRRLPHVDLDRLRADIESVVDSELW
jgi:antitoxin (DNA-binding transcriptional repressor) of toxin-antitoxin stability system